MFELSLADLLANVSLELDRQAADVRALHSLVDVERGEPPREAQLIDLVSQHLDELGAMMRRLSADVVAGGPVAPVVTASIALDGLRRRLEGLEATADESNAGDFDFF